jgi:hypothetical protein
VGGAEASGCSGGAVVTSGTGVGVAVTITGVGVAVICTTGGVITDSSPFGRISTISVDGSSVGGESVKDESMSNCVSSVNVSFTPISPFRDYMGLGDRRFLTPWDKKVFIESPYVWTDYHYFCA